MLRKQPDWKFPTDPFAVWKPRDQEIEEIYTVQERRATDLYASKLWKGWSGYAYRTPSLNQTFNYFMSLEIVVRRFSTIKKLSIDGFWATWILNYPIDPVLSAA